MTAKDSITVKSCGNVFEDLGFEKEEAENLRIRSLLMLEIEHYLKEKNFAFDEISERFHLRPSEAKNLLNGEIDSFTIDMLVNILIHMGLRVNITIQDDAA
jgi:predicted XRE-type DNA-binding protein